MKRRSLLLALPSPLLAQGDPVFTLLLRWQRDAERATAARAEAFAQQAAALAAAPTPAAWSRCCLAWERLAAWPLGPLKERGALLRIDFAGLREPRLQQLVASWTPGQDASQLGSDVSGLPALEALLFPEQGAAAPLVQALALRLRDDARRLADAAQARSWISQTEERALAWRNEAVSGWLDGLELLRLNYLDKPLRPGAAAGKRPRARSGQADAALALRWGVLREAGAELLKLLAVQTDVRLAAEGDRRLLAADQALHQRQLRAAAQALAALHAWAQQQGAPALNVPAGFSDADGD